MNPRHFPKLMSGERGVALVMVMMLLVLTSAILAGFLVTSTSDVRLRAVDRTRTQAFYAAHAGLEKLTADLGDLFTGDFAPEMEDIQAIEATPPVLDDITFEAGDGLGYDVAPTNGLDEQGDPLSDNGTIAGGPFQGFTGLITPYTLTVTSRTLTGSEARLQRTMQTVAIPVFQFGVFSETDLTFSANSTFNFGGRVHTNGNLFLAAAAGGSLYITEKVTAAQDIIRTHLANQRTIGTSHNGDVYVNKASGPCNLPTQKTSTTCRKLLANEGSLTGFVGSAPNNNWMNIFGLYNGYLRNRLNGITSLQLPLVSDEAGGSPIDLIRRPVPGEINLLTSQRLYAQAAIRILLSDSIADITGLPGVSAGDPVRLRASTGVPVAGDLTLPPVGVAYTVDAVATAAGVAYDPPTAKSSAVANDGYLTAINTELLDGYIKIEYRNAAGDWTDVTMEWLNQGFTRRNIDRATFLNTNTTCAEPHPDAILYLQRIRHRPSTYLAGGGNEISICGRGVPAAALHTVTAADFWPLTLYDTREGWNRDQDALNDQEELYQAGVMHYIDLNVNNLRLWLADQLPGLMGAGSGNLVANDGNDGFALYFSDRRGNNDAANNETGEWGWENFINPGAAAGTVNGQLDLPGEDVNNNGTWQNYGQTARPVAGAFAGTPHPFTNVGGIANAVMVWNQAASGNAANNTAANRARVNPSAFFRRALKLTNGGLGNLPTDGLTIASENPVYVEGNYNALANGWGANNAPAAIMADAITILSANWNIPVQITDHNGDTRWWGHGDTRSMRFPHDPDLRPAAAQTWYRFATLSGKGRNWTQLGTPESFGTDGGVHNFMRLIESWSNRTLNYRGSLASFYFSRQALGLFRCCDNVYQLPPRNMTFDTNFLNPDLLPPKTPMFRDVNTTGFVQVTNRQ